ncbi:PAS domain S-box protein [Halorientalis brevis]|uniref:PAS domain S-box protein n=1 Tax=Halorientalis brevis TaxID=1126241 RepID=A0ABD6C9N8_9EURY|nr:PAS domain S-box protein [Halorientalis brevis]
MSTDGAPREIRVLAVTADDEYATQIEARLPADGDIEVTTVATVEEALDRLADGTRIDCIVSDHDLPDTDGVAFLEAVRAQTPNRPFILFTSKGSESLASQAISADVTDYLVKERHGDQWERLADLVRDAVSYSRSHGDLIEPHERAKDVLNAAHDTIAIVRDGRYEFVNDAGLELLGASTRAALIGTPVAATIAGDEHPFSVDNMAEIQRRDRSVNRSEARLLGLDGTETPVDITGTGIEWAGDPAIILVVRDISELKERKQELALKDRVMDDAPVGITIADATQDDHPLLYANERFQELTGYSEGELLGRNPRFLQGEKTKPEPVAALRQAIDDDESVTAELTNYRKDGSEFWNRVTVAPVENRDGDVTQYVGFQEDITERRESERSLRQFRRAVEAAGNVILITDTDGTIEYVNPAFESVTGYSSEEALGETPRLFSSGKMSDEYYENLWETVLAGDVWKDEIVNRRKSGELYHARETIAPLTDDDGDVTAFVAIQTDITEQKEREGQLQQYERAIEGANDLICATDTNHNYLFANRGYREYHDIEQDDISDLTPEEVLGSDVWETVEPHIDRTLAGNSVHYRMERSRPNRSDRTFDVRYYPLEDGETGEVEGVVATLRDVTPQKDRERQLHVLDRVLRHNLRNAMSVITGNAELIAAETETEMQGLAENIIETADQLLGVTERERKIVEVLSEARLVHPLEISAHIRRPVADLRQRHPNATIDLTMPEEVHAATIPQIEQAISELLDNAVEHSDRDEPAVSVTVESHPETVEVHIADDGPGIPEQEQTILTGEDEIDPLYHGSGLGLWLVNWIVTHSDGTLGFEENDPRGSVVQLTLPKTHTDQPIAVAGRPTETSGE